jgi:hypothetical protein
MGTLTLEVFTSVIESIRLQLDHDRLNSASIAKIYNTDNINVYDNSLLIKSLVLLLQLHFPKKDNHCDIEHYMFDMNFGKIGEQELITVEDLWNRLHAEPIVSTHPLIDYEKESYNSYFAQKG